MLPSRPNGPRAQAVDQRGVAGLRVRGVADLDLRAAARGDADGSAVERRLVLGLNGHEADEVRRPGLLAGRESRRDSGVVQASS